MILYIFITYIVASASYTNAQNLATDIVQLKNDVRQLQHENQLIKKRIDLSSPYCKLLPTTTCGPCQCKDDDKIVKKYYCDCQNLTPKRDCLQFYQGGVKVDGIYKVHQNNLKTIQVFCDQTTDGGGWTVIQRRTDGSVNFFRNWDQYKIGFGQLNKEHWLGNENLFLMTIQAIYPGGSELRVELEDWFGVKKYAKYSKFQIGSEQTKYQIHVSGYSGNAGDSLVSHNGYKFSTYNQDNDIHAGNCALLCRGGWWYSNCHTSNLNGIYYMYGRMGTKATGIHWYPFHDHEYPFMHSEMKMRRKV